MEYVVQAGDTLSAIARRFGVGLAALLAVNPEVTDPDLIFPGQVIRIPLLPPVRPPVGRCLYVVQPGDTLSAIAHRFGIDLTALIHANPQIANPDLIFPGQVIFVPLRRAAMPMPMERPTHLEMPMPMEMPDGVSMEMHMEMPMHLEMPMEAPGTTAMPGMTVCPPELPGEMERPRLPHPQKRPVPPEQRPPYRG